MLLDTRCTAAAGRRNAAAVPSARVTNEAEERAAAACAQHLVARAPLMPTHNVHSLTV
jgi:hypothetical protein